MRHSLLTLVTLFIFGYSFSQNSSSLSISELLINSSIRIECRGDTTINNKRVGFTSLGTGFYFEFKFDSIQVPVIVTNYHVIENSQTGILRFTEDNGNNTPAYGKIIADTIDNFGARWIKHPTQDLAILPLNPILNKIHENQNKDPFIVYYDESILPTKTLLDEVTSIEDVLMIGYPEGFWDSTNNLPVVRKGLTATPINLNYNQKPEFLLDVPIFAGSSGSPVVLYNQGSYSTKKGGIVVGTRIFLLGINVQSVNAPQEGELLLPPGNPRIQTSTQLPINIAIVIKSEELLKFKPIIQQLLIQKK
jgi:hypothetical protein